MVAGLLMDTLPYRHLTTLILDVDFGAITVVNEARAIVPVGGGRFAGERLSGTVLPGGADWAANRADGSFAIDVRLVLRTDDGAAIALAYTGRFLATPEVMARFRKGEQLAAGDYDLKIVARFECGDPRYTWLNYAIVVGVGEQALHGPVYHLFEIGQ